MRGKITEERENMIIDRKTRWLAGITGCVAAIAGILGFGLPFLAVPSLLIVGALVVGHWQRSGAWLLWIGALFLSLWILPYGCLILFSPPPTDHSGLNVIVMTAATVVLVVLCDIALIVEGVRRKRARQSPA